MTSYRFGIGGMAPSLPDWRRDVRHYETLGFDFLAAADHIGGLSPFPLLAAAATVSDRLRLRSYVLNAGFWNPVLLARDAATLDRLSNGRLELGLGAGTVKREFDTAGIPWRPLPARIKQMQDTLLSARRWLADPDLQPRPVQEPIPLLIGAMSRAGLAVAAQHAEVVAFSGLRHKPGRPPGTLTAATAAQTDELVDAVRRDAGGRAYESDVLLQAVELGKDPLAGARAWNARHGDTEDPEILAESPCVLFARTAAQAAAEVERRRRRWGFTSLTTFAASADGLAAVLRELRS